MSKLGTSIWKLVWNFMDDRAFFYKLCTALLTLRLTLAQALA